MRTKSTQVLMRLIFRGTQIAVLYSPTRGTTLRVMRRNEVTKVIRLSSERLSLTTAKLQLFIKDLNCGLHFTLPGPATTEWLSHAAHAIAASSVTTRLKKTT